MKKMVKVILAAAAVVALAVPAMGADKLIVKNAAGTADVFKVSDDGSFTGGSFVYDATNKKLGSGLSVGHAPEASFHITDFSGIASRGAIIGQHNDGAQAANLIFRKTRGTDLAPTIVSALDYIGSFHANAFDGVDLETPASVFFRIDNTPAVDNIPTSIIFGTGGNSKGGASPYNKTNRLIMYSNGIVGVGTTETTAPTMTGAAANGKLYMAGDTMRLATPRTPSPSTSACNQGEISWDSSYIYVCTATNTWKRSTLAAY